MGEPVTLWLCECEGNDFRRWREESTDDVDVTLDHKYKALPVAEFDTLSARVDALTKERDGFVKANVALDARLLATEKDRDALAALLKEARPYVDEMANWTDDADNSHYAADPTATEPAKALLARIDAAGGRPA